mmetsp:Transcript_48650/g.109560  ORF Transcript_48650/g.109560 Transcript_48650/m.109560 type:complete len:210 (-) Transcript_48650:876-1505(-)
MDISTRAPEPSLVARCSASGLRLSSAARCTLHALRRPRSPHRARALARSRCGGSSCRTSERRSPTHISTQDSPPIPSTTHVTRTLWRCVCRPQKEIGTGRTALERVETHRCTSSTQLDSYRPRAAGTCAAIHRNTDELYTRLPCRRDVGGACLAGPRVPGEVGAHPFSQSSGWDRRRTQSASRLRNASRCPAETTRSLRGRDPWCAVAP